MTQQEQICLVNGQSFFGTGEIPAEHIPRLQMLDGGTGINYEQLFGDFLSHAGREGIGSAALRDVLAHFYEPERLSVEGADALYQWICEQLRSRVPDLTPPGCYPPGMELGATWDPETVEAVGHALGQEARAFGVNVLLGTPNVNIHRDPRAGRCFEGYSEDPCLVTQLAPALVRGVEAEGVAANVKHFAANNQETNRLGIDELISQRALHEIYYPGFRACCDAGCATLMAAYNAINGVPCTENRAMLTDLLRDTWGYDGLVMSDWGAVYHPAEALCAGTDLNMPGPVAPDALTSALADGTLDSNKLAEAAERVKRTALKYAKPATGKIDIAMTDKAAYEAAAEGIVMLENQNGCCPLQVSSKIALHGAFCEYLLTCGEGSAHVNTTRNVSFLQALRARFQGAQIGCFDGADSMIYVYSTPGKEGNDRASIGIDEQTANEINVLCTSAERRNMRKILVLNISAPVSLGELIHRFDAVFCIFLPGMQGAAALADILCGRVNPSGRLPLTFPLLETHMPTSLHFPGDGMQVTYGEGIFVGYRWYTTLHMPALYPFGYGLSYTDFALTDITTDQKDFTDGIQVTVTVRNTGSRAGKTVVQLYVHDPVSHLTKPLRELKAFRKLHLEAGETQQIVFTLPHSAFESYDPNLCAWTAEEGVYVIEAGFSAEDIRSSAEVYAAFTSPYSYGAETAIKTIYENDVLQGILHEFMNRQHLPWTAVLTSYEYTAQDSLGKVLDLAGCPADCRGDLFAEMRTVRRK